MAMMIFNAIPLTPHSLKMALADAKIEQRDADDFRRIVSGQLAGRDTLTMTAPPREPKALAIASDSPEAYAEVGQCVRQVGRRVFSLRLYVPASLAGEFPSAASVAAAKVSHWANASFEPLHLMLAAPRLRKIFVEHASVAAFTSAINDLRVPGWIVDEMVAERNSTASRS